MPVGFGDGRARVLNKSKRRRFAAIGWRSRSSAQASLVAVGRNQCQRRNVYVAVNVVNGLERVVQLIVQVG